MNLRKVVLALVLASGMSLGGAVAAGAQLEPGGAVNFTKVCGPGVSGTATFALTLTFEGVPVTIPDFPIDCGASDGLPPGGPIGTQGTLHETTPPMGAVAAADVHFTITAVDQSFTIVNNPPVSGGLSIHKVCPAGFIGTASFAVAFTLADDSSGGSSTVDVPCGQTKPVVIPASANFTNTRFSAHESSPPLGTTTAADQSGTLSASAQTLTFTDTAAAGPAGVLSIHKTCAAGVSGSATFAVTVAPAGVTSQSVNATVACGTTVPVAIPAGVALVGAAVTVHESTPPTNGAAAADVTATLSADAQTLTINDALHSTGTLSIHKTCASGVSGTATFAVTVTPPDATAAQISVNVACGQTTAVAVPAAKNVIGSAVKIHESTPPTHGVAAADASATLTASAQTVTINNTAAPAAVVPVLAQTGRSGLPTGGLSLLLGAMLIASGVDLLRRRTI
jgi:hypothetical protein